MDSRTAAITCPTCGDVYDTPQKIREMLSNCGYCVNITCLQDLTEFAIELPHPEPAPQRR